MRKSARTQIPPFFDNDPYIILAQCQCWTQGAWGHVPPPPPPPPEEAVSVLKIAHYMYGNGLVEVWGGLGCFGVFQWSSRRLC